MPFETFKAKTQDGKLQGYYIHKELFLGDEGQVCLSSYMCLYARTNARMHARARVLAQHSTAHAHTNTRAYTRKC